VLCSHSGLVARRSPAGKPGAPHYSGPALSVGTAVENALGGVWCLTCREAAAGERGDCAGRSGQQGSSDSVQRAEVRPQLVRGATPSFVPERHRGGA